MAVPKKRTSKPRKRMRRAHHHLTFTAATMVCPTCGATKLRHHICDACGSFRGQKILAGRD